MFPLNLNPYSHPNETISDPLFSQQPQSLMDESSGSSPENGGAQPEMRGNKRLKKANQDRISALPDPIIHLILSFLPSTLDAIRTGILSKRWRNQWTHVPVLVFHRPSMFDMTEDEHLAFSDEDYGSSIGKSLLLNTCSKISKLHLRYDFEKDPDFGSKLRFALSRKVEELTLMYYSPDEVDPYLLPKILIKSSSIVQLQLFNCYLSPNWSVNWGSLKALKMNGASLPSGKLIGVVLSGCPLIELLELTNFCDQWMDGDDVVIASKSLKTLVFVKVSMRYSRIEISCPNLEDFAIRALYGTMSPSNLPAKTVEKVLARSRVLRSLELADCWFADQLAVASKSVKRIVLQRLENEHCSVKVSCPNLEDLSLCDLSVKSFELMNSPSSLCAIDWGSENVARMILGQLKNVKELRVGRHFVPILSTLDAQSMSYPFINSKILTLNGLDFELLPGIVCALRSSPVLENLVINLQLYVRRYPHGLDRIGEDFFEKNYWKSNETNFKGLVSHLKTVKIVGLLERNDNIHRLLHFIEFLLKSATVLDKMVIVLKGCGSDFALKVSQLLLGFPRCSQHSVVEMLCS